MREWRRQIEGRALLKRKKASNMSEYRGRRYMAKGQGLEGRRGEGTRRDDLRENEFEELVGAIVRFPELRVRSQYAQEIAIFSGAHNESD
jgi:hypothetical protein